MVFVRKLGQGEMKTNQGPNNDMSDLEHSRVEFSVSVGKLHFLHVFSLCHPAQRQIHSAATNTQNKKPSLLRV